MSFDFDPVKVEPHRRRVDPVRLVILVIVVGLAVAIVKPWANLPTPDAKAPPVAVVVAPSVAPSDPQTSVPSPSSAVTAVANGLPAPTWTELGPVIKEHDLWGVRAILIARRPAVGLPASPRFVERWARVTPDSPTAQIAEVARNDQAIVALGVTFPPEVEPLDMRIWRLHANDQAEWIDARPLHPVDRDGSYTFTRTDPSGRPRSWEAGQYLVDVLAMDRLYSMAVQIPGRFERVPAPDDWPVVDAGLIGPGDSDPSGVQSGPFATVDGIGVPLATRPTRRMSEEQAWREDIGTPQGGPGVTVATAYLPRATGLGVMLTNHAAVQSAVVSRIAPDTRFPATPMVGGISELRGRTPWIAFGSDAGGAWPPGVYAITVHWSDPAGAHVDTWHVELRPGPIQSGVANAGLADPG